MNDRLDDPQFRDEIYDWAGRFVQNLVRAEFRLTTSILDVGAGQGKYRYLLHEYDAMDACEAWPPTIQRYELWSLYRDVFNTDVQTFVDGPHFYVGAYDLVGLLNDLLDRTDERHGW